MPISTFSLPTHSSEGAQVRRSVQPNITNNAQPFESVLTSQKQNGAAQAQAFMAKRTPQSLGLSPLSATLPANLTGNITGNLPSNVHGQLANTTPKVTTGTSEQANKLSQSSQENADRANRLAQAEMDKKRMQALDMLMQNMSSGTNALDVARNAAHTRNLRSVIGSFGLNTPVFPMADSIKAHALQNHRQSGDSGMGTGHRMQTGNKGHVGIGRLSAEFESGKDSIAAIGYDRVGGTSYGKYQIASRVGSMNNFLNFLDKTAPDMAKQLRSAGSSDTGGREGKMPDTWRKLAAEAPDRFEALQDKFIYDSHYKPALEAITERTAMKGDAISSTMQEVLWSTAVQHGPSGAVRIFSRAAATAGNQNDENFDKKFINNVYAIRAEQFSSSTQAVQTAVRSRMQREKSLALNMLQENEASNA